MSKLRTGSMCLTDILEQAKKKHSAFSKAENGKIYFNIKEWNNDTPDKYGNTASLQLNAKKDAPESEQKIYIGNLKDIQSKEPEPVNETDTQNLGDDLPF